MAKRCSKCKETKPLIDFSKDRSRKDGLNVWCKVCKKAYMSVYGAKWQRTSKGRAVQAAVHHNRRIALDGTPLTGEIIMELIAESNGICSYCKKPFTKGTGHVDHIVPVSDGGTSDHSNVVYVCADCNRRKGTKSLLSFIMELRGWDQLCQQI